MPSSTPAIGFNFDDSARTATVSSAPANIHWGDIRFTCAGSATPGTAVATDSAGTGITPVAGATPDVTAGDVISGCNSGDTLTVSYTVTNGLVAQHKFV
ncbi:MAG: hypothetical protein ABR562_04885 [Thermoplasmatota archaeon]